MVLKHIFAVHAEVGLPVRENCVLISGNTLVSILSQIIWNKHFDISHVSNSSGDCVSRIDPECMFCFSYTNEICHKHILNGMVRHVWMSARMCGQWFSFIKCNYIYANQKISVNTFTEFGFDKFWVPDLNALLCTST